MDLLLRELTLLSFNGSRCQATGTIDAKNNLQDQGERGEVILPLILCILTSGLLFSGIFWLNRTYELKTKEHLSDFQTRWNNLEKKYQD